ncbi:MAG: 2-aminoethylphosphonate--pyruvate transaminase [Rhodocyclaceae bacterium]
MTHAVDREPILLTPGPLTTSATTKAAMLRDWGSWDGAFNAITGTLCADLVDIAHGRDSHVCVPLQGSGTFAVEAALGTLTTRGARVLVPHNGAYCQRIVRILEYLGREPVVLPFAEDEAVDPEAVAAALTADPTIGHVALVHCETGTGILNPLERIADVVAARGRRLVVDAMSSFAAIDIDLRRSPIDAVVAASGKCLEGVPGMGFVIARRQALERAAGNSHSLAMDLHDQWRYLEQTTQWRFTPPTHVVVALRAAVDQFLAEGGQPARLARYRANCDALVTGMRALGLRTFLADGVQAPIIVTFHAPRDPAYRFSDFYQRVRQRGFILYPGKLTAVDTFRMGCIGAIGLAEIRDAVSVVAETLETMGVRDRMPA